jgi:hypothetical protein
VIASAPACSNASSSVRRNVRGAWSISTIRAVLKNPTYLGRLCWDRTDHSMKRERGGGSARRRDEPEWVYSEVEHPAIVSRELFNAAQARFRSKIRAQRRARKNQHVYLLPGFVKCASGHAPLAMFGRQVPWLHLRLLQLRAHLRQGGSCADRTCRLDESP